MAEGATIDYETKGSYSGKVKWTVNGQEAVANLTIDVTDLEATIPSAPTLARTQISEPSAPALDVTWKEADANGLTIDGYRVKYRIKVAQGETENTWTQYTYTNPKTGTEEMKLPVTARSVNLPGLTPGAVYEVVVRAMTTEEGGGPWSAIGEGRANRPPVNLRISYNTSGGYCLVEGLPVAEFTPPISINFRDPDGDDLTYSIESANPGFLRIWLSAENNPQLQCYNPGFEVAITYGALDPYGGYASGAFSQEGFMEKAFGIDENSPPEHRWAAR